MENYTVELENNDDSYALNHTICFRINDNKIATFALNSDEFWIRGQPLRMNEIIEKFEELIIKIENREQHFFVLNDSGNETFIEVSNDIITFGIYIVMRESTFSVKITNNLIEVFREIIQILRHRHQS